MFHATKWGIGISPDSVTYIKASDNFLNGLGLYLSPDKPMTHYPPLYSLALSIGGFLGTTLLDWARYLHIFFYCANTSLIWLIIHKDTCSSTVSAFIGTAVALSSSLMIHIHSVAWSEPLFIFMALAGLIFLLEFFKATKLKHLAVSGLLIGLALLTRYSGVVLFITCLSGIIVFATNRKLTGKTFHNVIIFSLCGMIPISLWFIRNFMLANTLTNRSLDFHPITVNHINKAVATFSEWLQFPQRTPAIFTISILIILITASFAASVILFQKQNNIKKKIPGSHIAYLPLLSHSFIFIYFSLLMITISFFDAHTPLDHRIMSPVFILYLIGITSLTYNILLVYSFPPKSIFPLILILLLFIVLQIKETSYLVTDFYNNGRGYTGREWKTSEAVFFAKNLPQGTTIFTNAPDALHILAGIHATYIPKLINPATQKRNENFETEIAQMVQQIERNDGVLIYFNMVDWRGYLPTNRDIARKLPVKTIYQGEDGTIYETVGKKNNL
jgi:4-amino-4-deoxy-L-arabinose transferase-like glycosyltransferase